MAGRWDEEIADAALLPTPFLRGGEREREGGRERVREKERERG